MLLTSLLYLVVNDIPIALLTQRLTQALNSVSAARHPALHPGRPHPQRGRHHGADLSVANNLVGAIPGGLGHVNILGSMIFAGMSGVAVADLGGMGQVEVKAMRAAGYPERFTAGITAASAIVGPVIPQSIPFILYSVASDASVLALFAAGIIPGVLICLVLMAAVFIYSGVQALPVEPWPNSSELASSFVQAAPALFAPVLLIGGMLSGVFSPTEAAASRCSMACSSPCSSTMTCASRRSPASSAR
jgi:tripartite ATP-independent transporter DctM subunit